MAFQPGAPKIGGRKKGTPNKKTAQLLPLFEQLKANNFDPVKRLLELYPVLEPSEQASLLLKLMDFIFPKKRSVETTEKPSKEELAELVREHLDGEAPTAA